MQKEVMNTPTNKIAYPGFHYLQLDISEKIALLSLNNPPTFSLKIELLQELDHSIQLLSEDKEVKCIILTSTGKSFACGADIEEMSKRKTSGEAGDMSRLGQQVLLNIENCSKPVIAAINGFCMGGGLELALSCHICIATNKAIFGMPEINLGMIPAFGGSFRLPFAVGRGKAIQMILTGEKIQADEALSLGLITKIVPKEILMEEARTLANKLTNKSSKTTRLALRSVVQGTNTNIQNAMQIEATGVEDLYNSHDLKEGVFAYMEKRKPDFQDY